MDSAEEIRLFLLIIKQTISNNAFDKHIVSTHQAIQEKEASDLLRGLTAQATLVVMHHGVMYPSYYYE